LKKELFMTAKQYDAIIIGCGVSGAKATCSVRGSRLKPTSILQPAGAALTVRLFAHRVETASMH